MFARCAFHLLTAVFLIALLQVAHAADVGERLKALDEAEQQIAGILDARRKATCLLRLGEARVKLGDQVGAKRAVGLLQAACQKFAEGPDLLSISGQELVFQTLGFDAALALADVVPNAISQPHVRGQAFLLLINQEKDSAESWAKAVSEFGPTKADQLGRMYVRRMEDLTKRKDLESARAVAKMAAAFVTGHELSPLTVIDVADEIADLGLYPEARNQAAQVASVLSGIRDESLRTQTHSKVIRVLAKAGDLVSALDLTKTISNQYMRPMGYSDSFRYFSKAHGWAKAAEEFGHVPPDANLSRCIQIVSVAAANSGAFADAERILAQVEDPSDRAWGHYYVALAQREQGKLDEASASLERALTGSVRITVDLDRMRLLTYSLGQIGRHGIKVPNAGTAFTAAVDLLEDLPEKQREPWCTELAIYAWINDSPERGIAIARQAGANEASHLEQLAQFVFKSTKVIPEALLNALKSAKGDGDRRDRGLGTVAWLYASADRIDEALVLARTIQSAKERRDAFIHVARACGRSEDFARLRAILATDGEANPITISTCLIEAAGEVRPAP